MSIWEAAPLLFCTRHIWCDAVGVASSCLSITISILQLWRLIIFHHGHTCELEFPLPRLPVFAPSLWKSPRLVNSLCRQFWLCGWASVTVCVIMTGCQWGGLLLPDQLTTVFSLHVCLRGFASLFPLSLSPLCFVCFYQYQFVLISGLTSICLSCSPASSAPLHSPQWDTEGEEPIPPGGVTPGISSFSLLHSCCALPSTMTLLASERSLLIRNKFRSGEEPGVSRHAS